MPTQHRGRSRKAGRRDPHATGHLLSGPGGASASSPLEILRTRSLTTVVQEEVDRQIATGELAAGQRINENALAERLGISRGPIREACRALVEAGLLVAVRNRGVFVREIGPGEMAEVYDVRAALDRLAGETLAARITKDQLAALERLVRRMDAAAARGDIADYYPLNLAFHDSIIAFTENARLVRLYRGLIKEIHLSRRAGLVQGGGLSVSNQSHRQIIEALASRDPEQAGRLLAQHVLDGKRRVLALMGQAAADEDRLPAAV